MGKTKRASTDLSPREVEVISMLAKGLRTGQISEHLGIRCVTVDMHIRNARQKLNATTREQAVAIAVSRDIIKMVRR